MSEKTTSFPEIKKAARVVLDMSEDTRIREQIRFREKALREWNTAIAEARDEAYAEAYAEAFAEAKLETEQRHLLRLMENGFSEEDAKKLLGLSE